MFILVYFLCFFILKAASNGKAKLCREMVRRGADIDARNKTEYTPLHWAAFKVGISTGDGRGASCGGRERCVSAFVLLYIVPAACGGRGNALLDKMRYEHIHGLGIGLLRVKNSTHVLRRQRVDQGLGSERIAGTAVDMI